jgi:hypothetical protein
VSPVHTGGQWFILVSTAILSTGKHFMYTHSFHYGHPPHRLDCKKSCIHQMDCGVTVSVSTRRTRPWRRCRCGRRRRSRRHSRSGVPVHVDLHEVNARILPAPAPVANIPSRRVLPCEWVPVRRLCVFVVGRRTVASASIRVERELAPSTARSCVKYHTLLAGKQASSRDGELLIAVGPAVA